MEKHRCCARSAAMRDLVPALSLFLVLVSLVNLWLGLEVRERLTLVSLPRKDLGVGDRADPLSVEAVMEGIVRCHRASTADADGRITSLQAIRLLPELGHFRLCLARDASRIRAAAVLREVLTQEQRTCYSKLWYDTRLASYGHERLVEVFESVVREAIVRGSISRGVRRAEVPSAAPPATPSPPLGSSSPTVP